MGSLDGWEGAQSTYAAGEGEAEEWIRGHVGLAVLDQDLGPAVGQRLAQDAAVDEVACPPAQGEELSAGIRRSFELLLDGG